MEHFIDHKYSVIEIERMRAALGDILFPVQWYSSTSGMGGYNPDRKDDAERVESQLRTYMLAGIRPEEIEVRRKESIEQSEKQRKQHEKPQSSTD